jgi:hypothetical protein
MGLRLLLTAVIVIATAAFVVGTTIERHDESPRHQQAAITDDADADGGSEQGEAHEAGERHASERAEDEEARPFGVDVEAAPFVALAVLGSLGLALAAWARPGAGSFGVLVVAMFVFAALDIREVAHQLDESRGGLAILAAVIALLHADAGILAGVLATREQDSPGAAATIGL